MLKCCVPHQEDRLHLLYFFAKRQTWMRSRRLWNSGMRRCDGGSRISEEAHEALACNESHMKDSAGLHPHGARTKPQRCCPPHLDRHIHMWLIQPPTRWTTTSSTKSFNLQTQPTILLLVMDGTIWGSDFDPAYSLGFSMLKGSWEMEEHEISQSI